MKGMISVIDWINDKKQYFYEYIVGLGLLIMFWGGLLHKCFNSDTLIHMVEEDGDVTCRIQGGRYVIALIDSILLKMGIRTTDNISISMAMAFCFFALISFGIYLLFQQYLPKTLTGKVVGIIGSNLIFLNVLFAEPLMFSEMAIYFALAYFLAMLSCWMYAKKQYILMIVCMILSVCTYQNAVIFGAILTLFYIYFDEGKELTFRAFLRSFVSSCVYVLAGGINILSIRILEKWGYIIPLGKSEIAANNWIDRIMLYLQNILGLYKDAGGLLPNLWIPTIFMLYVLGALAYSLIKDREWMQLCYVFILFLVSHIILGVIPLAQSSVTMPPRMTFLFFLIQGCFLIIASVELNEIEWITIVGSGYLLIQCLFAQFIVSDHILSNQLDRLYVNLAMEKIEKYENNTGIKVKNLSVCHDAYAPRYYEEVNYQVHQINERSLGEVTHTLIQVVANRKFEKIEIDDETKEELFGDKDWEFLALDEQLTIQGDTAYWCIF